VARQAARMIDVRVVTSEAELALLEEDWERLQEQARVTSVFESFAWQHAWWRTYGKGRRPRILVARDAGAVVGILPLYIDVATVARYPVRLLRLVGTGGDTYPDDLGPILARSCEEAAARALAEAVFEQRGWDVLTLTDLQPESPFVDALVAASRRARVRFRTGRSERIAFMKLPASWDAWLASLHRDKRYRVKNIRKKLHAAHPDARFFVWDDAATLDAAVDRLAYLHRKRWQRVGASHAFATSEYVALHRAVMHACLRRDQLRLYCLEAAGEIVAMYYFYRFRDHVFLMQSGFDPDHADVKPGQVLLGHVIEHAIGEGAQVLDFLRGDHRYKDELATGERETVFVTAARWRPGAFVYEMRRRHLPALKAVLKAAWQRVQER
jgi:CelD/BcsL family acetyltransferase involved in cellulose biosynthesis